MRLILPLILKTIKWIALSKYLVQFIAFMKYNYYNVIVGNWNILTVKWMVIGRMKTFLV